MAFHERKYHVYAILGDNKARPWMAEVWQRISQLIAPLVAAARGRAGIRTNQYAGTQPSMKPVTFGRLAFDDKSAAKWTHESPGKLQSGTPSCFFNTELWCPGWGICERDATPPDLYLAVSSAGPFGCTADTPAFGSATFFAVATDFADERVVADVAKQLTGLVGSVVSAYQLRPWGRAFGDGASFTDAINDLNTIGMFASYQPQDRFEVVRPLKPEWQILQTH